MNLERIFEFGLYFGTVTIIFGFGAIMFAFWVMVFWNPQNYQVISLATDVIVNAGRAMLLGALLFLIGSAYIIKYSKAPEEKK